MARRSGRRLADKTMRQSSDSGPPTAMARMAGRSELTLRIVSSAVLAPLAVGKRYTFGA